MHTHVKVKFYVKMSQKRQTKGSYNVNVKKSDLIILGTVCRFTIAITLL
jgi:hypothetical protein